MFLRCSFDLFIQKKTPTDVHWKNMMMPTKFPTTTIKYASYECEREGRSQIALNPYPLSFEAGLSTINLTNCVQNDDNPPPNDFIRAASTVNTECLYFSVNGITVSGCWHFWFAFMSK